MSIWALQLLSLSWALFLARAGVRARLALYADGWQVLSDCPLELQRALTVTEEFERLWDITFSAKKCVAVAPSACTRGQLRALR